MTKVGTGAGKDLESAEMLKKTKQLQPSTGMFKVNPFEL